MINAQASHSGTFGRLRCDPRETTVTRRNLLYIRWGVFMLACGFLWVRLGQQAGVRHSWWLWRSNAEPLPWGVLAGVGMLMLVNWGAEALKWRWLMEPVQRLSFVRACQATIAGTSIGLITPNRVGEFAGRVLFLDPEHRVQGSFCTLLGSIAQFVVTLLIGALVLPFTAFIHSGAEQPGFAWDVVGWCTLLISGAAVFLYFNPRVFGRMLLAVPWLKRYEQHAQVLGSYDRGVLLRVFLLSLARYGVFTLQFVIVLGAIAHVEPFSALSAVPVVFLITTLVPTMALTELGVRGSVAASVIPGDDVAIIVAATMIWIINIVLPALVGALILLGARIRTGPNMP